MPESPKLKLLADENIPDELVDLLIDRGHDVLTVTPRAKDPEVALLAKKEHRILITQDKDLANILWYPPKDFHGIIRLKFHPPVISDLLSALENLFQEFTQKDLDKKLITLEKGGFRIR